MMIVGVVAATVVIGKITVTIMMYWLMWDILL